ncbi:MAG: bactofilin family protein [Desulfovibrio sp.]
MGNSLNAFIGDKTEYKGRLDFSGSVRIDGRFEGEIVSDGRLILGRNAQVIGTVRVNELMCNGHVTGDVFVEQNTTLMKHTVLKGSVTTAKLSVEEGAMIEGALSMSPEKKAEPASTQQECVEPSLDSE